jgi:hypothetical protein
MAKTASPKQNVKGLKKMARVWIIPLPLASFNRDYEPVHDRTNDFFEIACKKSTSIFSWVPTNEDYVLCLKNGGQFIVPTDIEDERWVIAASMTKNGLESNWQWVLEEIVPTLDTNPEGAVPFDESLPLQPELR